MKESRQKPSRSQMASNNVECWSPHFSVCFFSAMLKTAFHDDTVSMAISYRTDGKLFNLRRLQIRTKVKDERVCDSLFADYCALNASSEDEMLRNIWTNFHLPAMPLELPPVQRKRRSCFSQHPTQTTQSHATITVKG